MVALLSVYYWVLSTVCSEDFVLLISTVHCLLKFRTGHVPAQPGVNVADATQANSAPQTPSVILFHDQEQFDSLFSSSKSFKVGSLVRKTRLAQSPFRFLSCLLKNNTSLKYSHSRDRVDALSFGFISVTVDTRIGRAEFLRKWKVLTPPPPPSPIVH